MPSPEPVALIDLARRGDKAARDLATADGALRFSDFATATALGGAREKLAGRSVLLLAGDSLKTAAALIELDGVARRLVLCPPDLRDNLIGEVAAIAEADAVVHGGEEPPGLDGAIAAHCRLPLQPAPTTPLPRLATEWLLLTSGTTGVPKLVSHDLATLTGAFAGGPSGEIQNWATFYDIRRYGGLQILLRAVAGFGSLTLTSAGEPIDDFIDRAIARSVTHISGTPSHWRRVLMSRAAARFKPAYVRLSGEIADAAILGALKDLFPQARIAHAYASTEAGVGFEVNDGEPGFPASYLGERDNGVAMKIEDGSLRIRSPRAARRYIGRNMPDLRDKDGFIDTGDMIERRGERCYFVGRRGGVINVGGAKVHPEEVEAVINRQAGVRMSLVKARRNPIASALVVADVVLESAAPREEAIREAILAACRAELAPYKAPAIIRFVPNLAMTPAGKLARDG
ncbi:MAG TPA: class I adenylate-forming enzyme family protein [Roseiarcus sp.]|nr:class I adenylate-forming enzyme family protein [Roseiarcus sp.]